MSSIEFVKWSVRSRAAAPSWISSSLKPTRASASRLRAPERARHVADALFEPFVPPGVSATGKIASR